MGKLLSGFLSLMATYSPLVKSAVIILLFLNAVCIMLPFKAAREIGLKAIPWLALGSAIALLATSIGTEFVGNFNF